jgi:hypothetical protein
MPANGLVVKASVVFALAAAALLSPPAAKPASAASACGFCVGGGECPSLENLFEYDILCSVCGYGSYAGGCSEGVEGCGGFYVHCFFIE